MYLSLMCFFFFSSRRRHTRFDCDWSSDVCSSDLLNTSALARGVALALPLSVVNRVVDALLAKGRIARGYVGVGLQAVDLPAALASKLDPPRSTGLIVLSVDASGPGGRGGLQLGDRKSTRLNSSHSQISYAVF